ncbi:Chloride channel protein 2 [Armadillidium nasatum]|uniref:Chloride channel protein 2 n=1 Tax=Armadillidium nasatum TaxID=96803 RepID=A0A5N5T0G0_9CRUS|nr:Chloride channel protein 2 [Armadillidium nasatum]
MNRTKYCAPVKQTDQKSIYSYDSTENDSSTYNFEINEGSKFSNHFGLLGKCWKKTFGQIKGDWVFLTLLGVVMAFISLFVEIIIGVCVNSRVYLFYMISDPFLKFWGWICIPVFLIVFATGLTKLIAPQAAGSGVPELRTAMLGIPMKGSFSFKALCTKIIGLGTTLGTGLPYGKEGPFVHISSMVAVLLTKLTSNIRGVYADKARNMEMLAAACAVGVTAAFAAPIGGVLFSIEVTAVHFAVRNYWRGFYAAVCGTVMHRFLAVWFNENADFTAVYKTSFYSEEPYALPELLFFALLGAIMGVIGALFVWSNRKCTMFKNNNRIMKTINRNSVFWYPLLVTGIFTTLTFPLGLGYFITSTYTTGGQITEMFVNYSWQKPDPTVEEYKIIYAIFPNGFDETNRASPGVMPGGYAIAGAAALAGAATHTVSSSVIAFELTGQISFAIPVLLEKDLHLYDDDVSDGSEDLKIEIVNEQETKTEKANHVTKPETPSEDLKSSTEKDIAEEPSDENPEATPLTETTSLLKPSSDIQSIDGEPEPVSEYPPGVGLPIEIPNTPDFKLPTQRRRSSRFSVTKVEGPLPSSPLIKEKEKKEEPIVEEKEKEEYSTPNSPNSTVTHGSLPKKSILKKTRSFVFEPNKPGFASKRSYATVHGDISKGVRQSLAVFMKAKSLLRMDSRSSHITFTGPTTRLIKIIKEMESEWENREMEKTVDFTKCQINPAPHQLVERSNLLQVHSIFSLLGLHHSYVTAIGRLIGVVGLKELQQVIVQVNSGDYVKPGVINNKRYSFGFLTLR